MAGFIDMAQADEDKPDDGKNGDDAVKQGKQITNHRGVTPGKRVGDHVTKYGHQSLAR